MPSLCHIHIGRPIVMCGTSLDKNSKMKERREDHLFAKGEKEAPIYQVGKIGAKYLKMESIDEKGPKPCRGVGVAGLRDKSRYEGQMLEMSTRVPSLEFKCNVFVYSCITSSTKPRQSQASSPSQKKTLRHHGVNHAQHLGRRLRHA